MARRDRHAALRAVEAAVQDAAGKLHPQEPLPAMDDQTTPSLPEHTERPPESDQPHHGEAPPPALSGAEHLLPREWQERVSDAADADPVEVHGERVRRRMQEESVYLATRVPRSLRDALRRRSERLEVTMQDLIVLGMRVILDATARAADDE